MQVLAASTDGAQLLSGDEAGMVRIWNTSTATAVAEYGFGGDVHIDAAAFHPLRSERVALSMSDQRYESSRIVLFDLAVGREIGAWPGQAKELAFSPDGRYLAGKSFSLVSVWNVDTREFVVGLQGEDGRGIGFRDERTLIYRDKPGIRLIDVNDGTTRAVLPSEGGKDFAILGDRRHLVDLRPDTVVLWDLDRSQPVTQPTAIPPNDRMIAAADGSVVFAVKDSGYLFGDTQYFVTMLSGQDLTHVTGVTGLTTGVGALLVRDGILYLGQRDGRIRRWRVEAGGKISFARDLGRWSSLVNAVAVSADQRLIALGDAEGVVDVFDVVSGVRRTYDPYKARPVPPRPSFGTTGTRGVSQEFIVGGRKPGPPVIGLQFERDGYALWTAHRDGTVRVVEPISMTPISESKPAEFLTGQLKLDPSGRIVAVARNWLLRWPKAGMPEKAFALGQRDVADVAIDPQSGTVAAIANDGGLQAFTADGIPLPKLAKEGQFCVLPIGRDNFLTPNGKGFLRFNARSGEVIEDPELFRLSLAPPVCATNGRRAAIGAGTRIAVFDLDGTGAIVRRQIFENTHVVASMAWIGGVDLLAVGSASGTVDFLDGKTGTVRWRLTDLGSAGWIFDSPSGRFDAPEENWSDVVFTQPDNRLKIVSNGEMLIASLTRGLLEVALRHPDDLEDLAGPLVGPASQGPTVAFLEPAATIKIAAGPSSAGMMTFTGVEGKLDFPSISVGEPDQVVEAGPKMSSGPVLVRIRVDDAGSGIGACRLLRNRQLVWSFAAPEGSPPDIVRETRIDVRPGQSELSAFCFSRDGVPSLIQRITVATEDRDQPAGTAYVIAAGINAYRHKLMQLIYAVPDAELFGSAVSAALKSTKRYRDVVPLVLTDDDVTRETLTGVFDILAGATTREAAALASSGIVNIDHLRKATADDAVLMFFAGHGEMREKVYRILMHNYDGAISPSAVLTDVDFKTFFGRLDATELVLVLDACQAGGALTAGGNMRLGPFNSGTFAQMAYDKGVFFLAAAADKHAAREETQFGHGLLTQVLVNEGLVDGKADRTPADGTITVRELLEYPLAGVPGLHAALQRSRKPSASPPANGNPLAAQPIVDPTAEMPQTPKAYLPAFGFNDAFVVSRSKTK